MINDESIIKTFKWLCNFSRKYNSTKGPVRSSQPSGIKVVNQLNNFGIFMHECLENENKDQFWYQVSKGQSNIPKVLWASILPQGRKVSNSNGVTLCFGTRGEGAVVGVLESVLKPQKNAQIIKRSDKEILVNVDGQKPGTKYNDKFYNPLEILIDDFSPLEIKKHINTSISILMTLA